MSVSAADVKYRLDNLRSDINQEETEDNWERITKAIVSFVAICEKGGYEAAPGEVVNALRNSHRQLTSAMNSERTRLCGAAIDLFISAAAGLGGDFEQLLTLFMPTLLALCGRTNKVVINRARTCIFTIIESTQLASVLPYFLQNLKDKSVGLRLVIAEGTLACLNSCNPPDLEKESRAREVEAIIRGTARDANADVRKVSRKIFECYKILLPGRVESFTAPLTPTMKKYLDIKPNNLSNKQSSSNLRTNLNMQPTVKQSTSTSVSTSKPGHSRTASSSTMPIASAASQSRSLASSLTRVARKEAPTIAPAPYVPVRPVQPARIISDSQPAKVQRPPTTGTVGATRTAPVQEGNRPAPPLRSQTSSLSRVGAAASTVAPHRAQLPSIAKAASGSQAAAPSGPRRVPMPMAPPPPPSAAAIQAKEKIAPKRPISRTDNASSVGQRPVAGSASSMPPKRPISRTDNASSVGQRPVASTASSVPPKKAAPVAVPSLKPRVPTAKESVLPKPKQATTAATSSTANVKALAVTKPKPLWGRTAATKPAAATTTRVPTKTLTKKPSKLVSAPPSEASKTRPTTPALIALPPSPEPTDSVASKEPEEMEIIAHVSPEPTVAPVDVVPQAEEEKLVEEPEVGHSPMSQHDDISYRTFANHLNAEQLSNCNFSPEVAVQDENPATPQGLLPLPAQTDAALSSKTPISALLSSIQRGFLYSPVSPLSPPDSYLAQAQPTTADGSRPAFNFALQPPQPNKHAFGRRQEGEMVLGDIGVVKLSDHKLFMPSSLGLDDLNGSRQAFVEINNSLYN
ncbi:clasp N terminal-domain-containing protein [Crassisporium funariophilum]|nr:clasp N terminal-domain-containing protein [Crassisporium funariophilum]